MNNEKYSTPAVDPVAQLLVQGGLRGFGETRGGNTANLSLAFEPAVGQAFDAMNRAQAGKRDVELEKFDIAEERDKKILHENKNKEKKTKLLIKVLVKTNGSRKITAFKKCSWGDKTAIQRLVDDSIKLERFLIRKKVETSV